MLYPIGETDSQSRRLITQAQLYNPSTRAFFQAAGISSGMRVLELGSGTGDVSLVLADLVGPSGRVVGVELKPTAVGTARSRLSAAGWRNVEYLAGAIESAELEQDFDAVVGRFVLMWLPDPLVVLERVVSHLRPGGVVAFQDNDFTFGAMASAPLPLFDQVNAWLKDTMVQDGPDYHLGLKMQHLYQRVGLTTPQFTFDASIGTGNNWTGYQHLAETIEMLKPLMHQRGIALPAEIATSDLAEKIRQEVVENNAVIILPAIIGAWSRKP
ncbi:MAG: methyltransferase domain-containing protein [Anaerolineae bacterium]